MPTLGPWRELARKAAQSIKRQLAQTESGLSALLNPGRRPQQVPIPIPLPRRESRLPHAKRFYTQSAPSNRQTRARPSQFAKSEFGRTALRPRLTGTTRAHGYRNFSSSPTHHAQVMREVHASIAQGIRAGVLHAPFYPPPTHMDKSPGHVLHGVCGSTGIITTLSLDLVPSLCLSHKGQLNKSVVGEVDDAILEFPRFMSKLRRDLTFLAKYGALEYRVENNAMHFQFPGKSKEQVERWLQDIGVTRGIVSEQPGMLGTHEEREVDWNTILARSMHDSLVEYVDAIDAHRCAGTIMI